MAKVHQSQYCQSRRSRNLFFSICLITLCLSLYGYKVMVKGLYISNFGQEEGINKKGQCFWPHHWLDYFIWITLVARQANKTEYLAFSFWNRGEQGEQIYEWNKQTYLLQKLKINMFRSKFQFFFQNLLPLIHSLFQSLAVILSHSKS